MCIIKVTKQRCIISMHKNIKNITDSWKVFNIYIKNLRIEGPQDRILGHSFSNGKDNLCSLYICHVCVKFLLLIPINKQ